MNQITFSVVSDLEEAKRTWAEFTPDRHLFDLWDCRYIFYKYFNYPLHFIVGHDGDTAIGILPIQYNTDTKVYEFFGGYFMEENTVFVSPGYEEAIPLFYEQVPTPAHLGCITPQHQFEEALPLDDYKYLLPLIEIHSFEEFLNVKFNSEHRKPFKRRIRRLEELGVEIIENDPDALSLLFDFHIKHFGAASSFHYPFRKNIYEDLSRLAAPVEVYMLTFVVAGVKEGVSIGIKYKNRFIGFNAGSNTEKHPTLPMYINAKNIDYAVKKGATLCDFLMGDYTWKISWQFDKLAERKYEKN